MIRAPALGRHVQRGARARPPRRLARARIPSTHTRAHARPGPLPACLCPQVVRCPRTNKTKGYGFVSFRLESADMVKALREMNGGWAGGWGGWGGVGGWGAADGRVGGWVGRWVGVGGVLAGAGVKSWRRVLCRRWAQGWWELGWWVALVGVVGTVPHSLRGSMLDGTGTACQALQSERSAAAAAAPCADGRQPER